MQVYRYVVLVTNAVIPKALWGSKRNLEIVLECWSRLAKQILTNQITDVKEFISCRRFETLNLHRVLQGFSTSDCEWLMPPGRAALRQGRVSVSDSLKRRELLEDFVFWYFDSFVIPLLKVRLSPLSFIILDKGWYLEHFLHYWIVRISK